MVNRTIHLGKTPLSYVGAGDVLTTLGLSPAALYFSARPYSAAKLATAPFTLMHIRDSSDAFDSTINMTADGIPDKAAITAYEALHGASYTYILYEQMTAAQFIDGGGSRLSNITESPAGLTAGRWALGLPVGALWHDSGAWTFTQPFTICWVALSNGLSVGDEGWMIANDGADTLIAYNSANGGVGGTPNVMRIKAASGARSAPVTCTDNAYHACAAVFNGSSSAISVDGSMTTVSAGTGGFAASDFEIGSAFGQDWRGVIAEIMVLTGVALNSTQAAAIATNQKAYWGYT